MYLSFLWYLETLFATNKGNTTNYIKALYNRKVFEEAYFHQIKSKRHSKLSTYPADPASYHAKSYPAEPCHKPNIILIQTKMCKATAIFGINSQCK